MSENPYQSPAAPIGLFPAYRSSIPANAAWADGKYLVIPSGAVLPPVCIRTNQREFLAGIAAGAAPLPENTY